MTQLRHFVAPDGILGVHAPRALRVQVQFVTLPKNSLIVLTLTHNLLLQLEAGQLDSLELASSDSGIVGSDSAARRRYYIQRTAHLIINVLLEHWSHLVIERCIGCSRRRWGTLCLMVEGLKTFANAIQYNGIVAFASPMRT
jgi:hypothetical protein